MPWTSLLTMALTETSTDILLRVREGDSEGHACAYATSPHFPAPLQPVQDTKSRQWLSLALPPPHCLSGPAQDPLSLPANAAFLALFPACERGGGGTQKRRRALLTAWPRLRWRSGTIQSSAAGWMSGCGRGKGETSVC